MNLFFCSFLEWNFKSHHLAKTFFLFCLERRRCFLSVQFLSLSFLSDTHSLEVKEKLPNRGIKNKQNLREVLTLHHNTIILYINCLLCFNSGDYFCSDNCKIYRKREKISLLGTKSALNI